MRLSLIVAMSRNRVIGNRGKLPWRLPDDQKNFRKVTMGHPLIMGRRTHESIGHPLDGRRNIVVTRQPDYRADGCEVARSVEAALALVADADEVFVIGGGAVYAALLPRAQRIYLTEVQADIEGDTFFPPLDFADWRGVDRRDHPADATHDHPFRYQILDRKANRKNSEG